MWHFYRATFGSVVAFVYTAGTALHVARLITRFSPADLPFAVDWGIVVLGTYGGTGLILLAREVDYRGTWEKVLHGLIAFHLLVSVALHLWMILVRSHDFLSIFPYGYSYLAVGYFGVFAWRGWTMRLKRRS